MGQEQESNKQAVAAFIDAMNRADVKGIVESYAEDGVVETMGNTLISGRRGKAEITAFAGAILETFPEGLEFEVLHMTAEDDRVAVEALSRGRHASGCDYSNRYHFLFFLREGKITRLREYMDTERVTDVLCGGQRPGDAG